MLSIFILLFLASTFVCVRSQPQPFVTCGINGNYTNSSAYRSTLSTLFAYLTTNISDNGFYDTSIRQNSDIVYGVSYCRSDIQLNECHTCLETAAGDIFRKCPNQLQAISWSYFCMIRYSNNPILGIRATTPMYNISSQEINPTSYGSNLFTLLGDLSGEAANGNSLLKVAMGSRPTGFSQRIYAYVQCTPDLSSADCTTCLTEAASTLRGCCNDARKWVNIFMPTCDVRYELEATAYNQSRFNQVRALFMPSPSTPPAGNDNNNNTTTMIIIAVSVAACVMVAIIIGVVLLKKRRNQKPKEELGTGDQISMVDSLQYDFEIIRAATNNFSKANELGKGGFGPVYKGVLRDGEEIAVKRLAMESSQGELEFKNEVTLLAKLQHRNLVRLLGFSLQENEKLLVYEFLKNLSLDNFIFDTTTHSSLDWDTRYKIIGGIARGILYLHEDSRLRIIHRDLKASNVLLDDELNPKIADFGTARLFVQEETLNNTFRIVGTFGYMAPEYAMLGQFSTKSDVFSFGVLMLEIISGRKNNSFRNKENVEEFLTRAAWRLWHNGKVSDLVDPMLKSSSDIPQSILRCIHIALLCVQEKAIDRPTMDSVVQMLKSLSMDLPKPSEPPFSTGKNYDLEASLLKDSNLTQTNEMTRTGASFLPDVHPR